MQQIRWARNYGKKGHCHFVYSSLSFHISHLSCLTLLNFSVDKTNANLKAWARETHTHTYIYTQTAYWIVMSKYCMARFSIEALWERKMIAKNGMKEKTSQIRIICFLLCYGQRICIRMDYMNNIYIAKLQQGRQTDYMIMMTMVIMIIILMLLLLLCMGSGVTWCGQSKS